MATGAAGHALVRRLPLPSPRTPSLNEALHDGEGQSIEFKRGLSENENRTGDQEDEILRSVAAFANTNDGLIFLGIDDAQEFEPGNAGALHERGYIQHLRGRVGRPN